MKKQILPLIVMLFLGLVSCEEIGVRGHGDVVSEFRDLNDFTAIKFRMYTLLKKPLRKFE